MVKQPRPNLRRLHPLDDYELALTDDGKTFQEEADDSVRMLARSILLACSVVVAVVGWLIWVNL